MGAASSTVSSLTTTDTASVVATTEQIPFITSAITTVSTLPPFVTPSAVATPTAPAIPVVGGASVDSTILVIARGASEATIATAGLEGYGIPYVTLIVPQTGVQLPELNSSATAGNYGGIIVHAEVTYNFGTATTANYASALTPDQWNQLYAYQTSFNVRMARLDVFPGPAFDTTAAGSCCNAGVEQLLSFTDVSDFPTAGLRAGAGVSSQLLWHYLATITNTTRTKQIASWAPSSDGSVGSTYTAAVINNFDYGRQQMAFFTSMATSWSVETNFLQHSWINWITRGAYAGRRRSLFSTQIDDVHLPTAIYYPSTVGVFRSRPEDYEHHVSWMTDINSRLPAGSRYIIELGHNGNGDILNATAQPTGPTTCDPQKAISYTAQPATDLEYQKALGTGDDVWPLTPTSYAWSTECAELDLLASWFMTSANRDAFAHISHTFTHLSLNNVTYVDASKEISFNVAWLQQTDISNAALFSGASLIPPAITGLHNGDAIRAWTDNGITNAVGDNTRPALMQRPNDFHPVITSLAANGYDGFTILPRWGTRIPYNCDTVECAAKEWQDTSAGSGIVSDLLADARSTNVRNLLSLRQDPFMFHQANMRAIDMPVSTVGPVSGSLSVLQTFVETVLQEFTRLTTWPLITLKQDDLAKEFINRKTRDACGYKLTYQYSSDGRSIASATVSTSNGNTCSAPIPVTVPGDATVSGGSATRDQVGADPLILWVTMSGSPVTVTYSTPVAL